MSRALSVVAVIVLSMVAGVALMAFGPAFLKSSKQSTADQSLSGGATAAALSSVNQAGNADTGEQFQLSPRELEKRIGEVLDDLGGHPDDPQLPDGVLGASDEVIASMDPMEIKLLLQDPDVIGFITRHEDEPRYAFALGRMAMFHGYTSMSEQLLRIAMNGGSGAAAAYLADPLFTQSDTDANALLVKAIDLGFEPAQAWLPEEPMAFSANVPTAGTGGFRFSDFDQPEVIQAFYEGRDPPGLSELETWAYINSFLRSISDTSNLFMVENPRAYYMELSPSVQVHAEIAMATSAEVMSESMNIGIQQFLGMLSGMESGGNNLNNLTGTVTQMNKNMIAPMQSLMFVRASGEHDGKRLALGYDSYTNDFRRVYAGVKRYVESKR